MPRAKTLDNSGSSKEEVNSENFLDKRRIMASLSYLGILFLVPLLLADKKDTFISFHLRQGIVLFIADVLISFIAWFPIIGWLLAAFATLISLVAFVQTLLGRKWPLPYIGLYAKKIKI